MTATYRPHPRRSDDGGFTLIELLVAVIVIGILTGIAIPLFINQRASAHDARVESDILAIAKAITGDADKLTGPLWRGSGDLLVVDSSSPKRGVALTLSSGTAWGIAGTAESFCLVGWAPEGARWTATTPLTYDAAAGGLQRTGAACTATTTPVTGASGTGGVGDLMTLTSGPRNLIKDSAWQGITGAAHLYTYGTGQERNVGAQGSASWAWVDERSPAGTRAVRVQVPAGTTRGMIAFTDTKLTGMDASAAMVLGQQVTVSAYVRAPAGQAMNLSVRTVDTNRTWKTESAKPFIGTGAWERITYTVTPGVTHAGYLPTVQVTAGAPYPTTSITFDVAGPQIERSYLASTFEVTAP